VGIAVPLVAEDPFLADQLGKFLLYGIFALSVDLVWG
jgi:ABC-type branched-subunit amino acid transport system permease subunit